MSKEAWKSTTVGNQIELRRGFVTTGSRFAQVLVKIDIDGVPPGKDYRPFQMPAQTIPDPVVVISMNGTAGLSLEEWGEMSSAINEGIAQAVRLRS